jgi:hypothetical protein
MAELIKSKQARMPLQSAPAPRPANVINLVNALRRSIAETERTAGVKVDVQEKSSKTKELSRQRAVPASRRGAVKKGLDHLRNELPHGVNDIIPMLPSS